ncbi:hypothetical protein JE959_000112 [Aeromonas veronii]|nr:hypothetical protein [Aeromonas veronii]
MKSYLYEIKGVIRRASDDDSQPLVIDQQLNSPIRNACVVLDVFIARNPDYGFQADTKLINEGVDESDYVKWYEKKGVNAISVSLSQIRYNALSKQLKTRILEVLS